MTPRPIGASGITTAPIVLGGNVFGWTIGPDESHAVLDSFVGGGGTMIDTADYYSAWIPGNVGGESETIIGQWLHRRGRRDDVQIATKVGHLPGRGGTGLTPERIAGAIDESLERLRTDYIDLYYVHRDDPRIPPEELLAPFDRLVRQGKVRAIALSNVEPDRLDAIMQASAATGMTRFEAVQTGYNLIDREPFESAIAPACVRHGLGALTYFALANGFLTGKYRTPADVAGRAREGSLRPYFTDRNRALIDRLAAVADRHGARPGQAALAWIAGRPGVTAPIASATSAAQACELTDAMRLVLTPDDIALLEDA